MLKIEVSTVYPQQVFWTFTDPEDIDESLKYRIGSPGRYRTNQNGEGIWRMSGDGTVEDKQITGTCQFNLRRVSRSTMRRRILQFLEV